MSEQNNPKVKILVSCHKEVPLPSSDIYLPVQVGSLNKPQLRGMQPDREGENIADRNFTFCELTAQYWAWKNLDADFYGLCHYRRYFCFDGIERPKNDHAQIETTSLSEYSFRDFHLNEDELIYECLKNYDVVTPPYWNISEAKTPDGIKKSVQEHMVAFGLYTNADICLLREIIQEKQPEYLQVFDEYMTGDKYLGYNCFVMRRDIFSRFCEFEFDVLLEFDRKFDYSNITSTRKRICGYLGEVLYSVFVAKIIQENEFRIKQVPLVFFLDTTPSALSVPRVSTSKETIQIVWRYRDRSANAFEVCIESLLEHIDPKREYELTILYDTEFILDAFSNIVPELPDNLVLHKTHWSTCSLPDDATDISLKDLDLIQPLLLPWLNESFSSVLWIDGLALFTEDPVVLLGNKQSSAYYCIKNALLHRELNKPNTYHFLGQYKLDPKKDRILDMTALVVNCPMARNLYSASELCQIVAELREKYCLIEPEQEIGKSPSDKKKTPVAPGYLLENQAFRAHVLNRIEVQELPFTDVSYAIDAVDTATWLNEDWSSEWKAAEKPILVYLEYGKPPILNANQRFGNLYWKQARKSEIYEVLLGEVLEPDMAPFGTSLFPEGSKRRKIAKSLMRVIRR